MTEYQVTISYPTIRIQPDEFAGKDGKRIAPSQLLDAGLAEFDVVNLKRARVGFSLQSSGMDPGEWNLEMLIALRGGQVHARPLPGGKQTTDFTIPLSGFVSMMTHPDAGGSAHLRHGPKATKERPQPLLIPIARNKSSVVFACRSGEEILSLFHELRGYAPWTVEW